MFKHLTSVLIGILLIIVVITINKSVYIVDETKQVFVTQFGKIVRGPINGPDKDEAGLYFRIPFINEVHAFEGSTTFLTARLGLLSPRTISSRSSARGNARPLSMRPRCSMTNPS